MREIVADIPLVPRRLSAALGVGVVALSAASFAAALAEHVFGVGRLDGLFSVNKEINVPTWYSVALLLLCPVVLFVLGLLEHAPSPARAWKVLAAVALWLSFDEAAGAHEAAYDMGMLVPGGSLPVLVALGGMVVLAITVIPLVRRIPFATLALLAAAAALYIAGAVGVDLVGERYLLHFGTRDLTYAAIVTLEEGMEMMAAVLAVYALLSHLGAVRSEFDVRIVPAGGTRATRPGADLIVPVRACLGGLLVLGLVIGAVSIALWAIAGQGSAGDLTRIFRLHGRFNAPTWYTSALLLGAAGLSALCARITRVAAPRAARAWSFLTVVFLALSAERLAGVHVRAAVWFDGETAFPYVALVPVVIALAFAVAGQRFLATLPAITRALLVAAGSTIAAGFVGAAAGAHDPTTGAIAALVQMTGALVAVYAVLTFLVGLDGGRFRLRVAGTGESFERRS